MLILADHFKHSHHNLTEKKEFFFLLSSATRKKTHWQDEWEVQQEQSPSAAAGWRFHHWCCSWPTVRLKAKRLNVISIMIPRWNDPQRQIADATTDFLPRPSGWIDTFSFSMNFQSLALRNLAYIEIASGQLGGAVFKILKFKNTHNDEGH